jgi:hypothetical protein
MRSQAQLGNEDKKSLPSLTDPALWFLHMLPEKFMMFSKKILGKGRA